MLRSYAYLLVVSVLAWSALGRADNSAWQPLGPYGGDVRSLTAQPHNPSRLFLGTSNGQVYSSADGGRSWLWWGEVGQRSDYVVDHLIVDSGNPAVMFAAGWSTEPNGGGGVYKSLDGGRTWAFLSRVNDWGAPGDIVEMADGRIVCVYGYRLAPYGIRARVSADGGRTWGSEIVLRDDGGSWDLGYPRVIEINPGRLLTVYYFNCRDDPIQLNGGIRHIACSVFSPD